MATTPATRKDAADRSVRTLLTGVGLDVAIAIAAALLAWLPDADVSSTAAWIVLGTAVTKTVLQAVASYVLRLKVAPATQG